MTLAAPDIARLGAMLDALVPPSRNHLDDPGDALARALDAALVPAAARTAARSRPPEAPLRPPDLRRALSRRTGGDRLPWPDRWWQAADAGDYACCRALWARVLHHGLADDLRAVLRGEDPHRIWALGRGCRDVCDLVGLNFDAVAQAMVRVCASRPAARAMLRRFSRGQEGDGPCPTAAR